MRAPYIDQLRDPEDPDSPLVPSGEDRSRPYYAVASPFPVWPRQVALEGNACLECHRIGTGAFAAGFVRQATSRSLFSVKTAWGEAWPQSHWMPPTGAASPEDWEATYGDDVDAILECLEGPSLEGCTTEIPSIASAP